MRFFSILLLIAIPSALWAQTEEAPVKRRRRILVYDQSADVLPVNREVEKDPGAKSDLERRIRQDAGAPSSLESPMSSIPLISLPQDSPRNSATEESEEKESWITPMDFLLEEDRIQEEIDMDPQEEENSAELEITDWEALQKSMIEEALKKEEPEMTDEEIAEYLALEPREGSEDSSENSGMAIEQLAPVQSLSGSDESRLADPVGSVGQFVPILQDSRQMNGEVVRPQRERDSRVALSGSAELLNNLKEKWGNPAEAARRPGSASLDNASLPRESLSATSLPSISLVNPAIRPLGESPSMRMPAAAGRELSPPPVRNEPASGSPRQEFRLRSQLGVPAGM
ncbi:MAG: hypothetical protein ACO3N7_08865 [Kiritimatiellia bacterium]